MICGVLFVGLRLRKFRFKLSDPGQGGIALYDDLLGSFDACVVTMN